MNAFPKFIIETDDQLGDCLIIAKCTFHKQLATDESKVKGGGWFSFNKEENTFILYGKSEDFGPASVEDIKDCIKHGRVFRNKALSKFYPDSKFKYRELDGEIIDLPSSEPESEIENLIQSLISEIEKCEPISYDEKYKEGYNHAATNHVDIVKTHPAIDKLRSLQKFKDYVHTRLDEMGIEKDPESEHKESGCRIGGRLDIVKTHIKQVPPKPQPISDRYHTIKDGLNNVYLAYMNKNEWYAIAYVRWFDTNNEQIDIFQGPGVGPRRVLHKHIEILRYPKP